MEDLVQVLPESGSMPFQEFVAEARAQGLRPELWHKAKVRGLLFTGFDAEGNLIISRSEIPVIVREGA